MSLAIVVTQLLENLELTFRCCKPQDLTLGQTS